MFVFCLLFYKRNYVNVSEAALGKKIASGPYCYLSASFTLWMFPSNTQKRLLEATCY